LLLMSIIIKSIGTKFMCSSIITLLILPKACLVESMASNRSISHFSSFFYQDQVYHITTRKMIFNDGICGR
jgi:hypothetical protein